VPFGRFVEIAAKAVVPDDRRGRARGMARHAHGSAQQWRHDLRPGAA
jgi:hypothetical protein